MALSLFPWPWPGSIPSRGTKIPQATRGMARKKKEELQPCLREPYSEGKHSHEFREPQSDDRDSPASGNHSQKTQHCY